MIIMGTDLPSADKLKAFRRLAATDDAFRDAAADAVLPALVDACMNTAVSAAADVSASDLVLCLEVLVNLASMHHARNQHVLRARLSSRDGVPPEWARRLWTHSSPLVRSRFHALCNVLLVDDEPPSFHLTCFDLLLGVQSSSAESLSCFCEMLALSPGDFGGEWSAILLQTLCRRFLSLEAAGLLARISAHRQEDGALGDQDGPEGARDAVIGCWDSALVARWMDLVEEWVVSLHSSEDEGKPTGRAVGAHLLPDRTLWIHFLRQMALVAEHILCTLVSDRCCCSGSSSDKSCSCRGVSGADREGWMELLSSTMSLIGEVSAILLPSETATVSSDAAEAGPADDTLINSTFLAAFDVLILILFHLTPRMRSSNAASQLGPPGPLSANQDTLRLAHPKPRTVKRHVLRAIANLLHVRPSLQERMLQLEDGLAGPRMVIVRGAAISLVEWHCSYLDLSMEPLPPSEDDLQQFVREWAVLAVRNLCIGNVLIQERIRRLQLSAAHSEQWICDAGLQAAVDEESGIVSLRKPSSSVE